MVEVSDTEFRAMVAEAIDSIPEKYGRHIANLAFVVEDEPSPAQLARLHPGQTLLGLYEGIPLTRRGAGYNLVLPDKITIFRLPILAMCHTPEQVRAQIKHTLWHEVAHYYGLDHLQIHEIEDKNK